jgi:predicted MPP superfamily phosphohydrolase
MRVSLIVSFFAICAVGALLHGAAWRWFRGAAPRIVARFRRPLLAVYLVLFLMPTARLLAFYGVRSPAWSMIGAVGMLWYLTLALTMASVGLVRGARLAQARLTRSPSTRREGASARALDEETAPVVAPLPAEKGVIADRHAVEEKGEPAAAPPAPSSRLDRREVLERAVGAAALVASSGAMAWGTLRGRYEWSIEEVAIRLPRLPKALDGFTIVQLSDLHVGTFIGERELDLGLGLLDKIRVDLVAITGDIVDSDPHYVPIAAAKLGALKARHGVVCVPGNHDYYTGENAVLGGMRRAGIDVMVNRGKVIAPGDGGGFALLGVDDLSARRTAPGTGPDLSLARSMVPPDRATVLLAHQPRFAAFAARSGVDLQLSGHTHGGQINPGFRLVDLFYRYVEGRYDIDEMQLYVNRGFGTAGPPTRVGAPPEITKIVLVAG